MDTFVILSCVMEDAAASIEQLVFVHQRIGIGALLKMVSASLSIGAIGYAEAARCLCFGFDQDCIVDVTGEAPRH